METPKIEQTKGDNATMELIVSEEVVEGMRAYLNEHGHLEAAVNLPFGPEGLHAVVSPNPDDLIAIDQIEYDGKVYYIGPPQE